MILKNYYYYFTSAIPAKICDRIISEATQQKPERGLVDNKEFKSVKPSNKEISKVKKVRESHVVWLNKPWIYKLIQPFVHEANKKLAGTFNGLGLKLLNLQFIRKTNTIIGMLINIII